MKRINFLVTNRCNLHCKMCDYRIISCFEKDLVFSDIKKVIDWAYENKVKKLEISGGEPMVRKDIYQIIHYAAVYDIYTIMMTNGVLIEKEQSEKLICAGLNEVVISLEGTQEINDMIRGTGNFIKAINAVRYFQNCDENKIKIKIGITVSKFNYKSLFQFTKYLFENVMVDEISYNPFNFNMLIDININKNRTMFELLDDDLYVLEQELEKIMEYSKYNHYIISNYEYMKQFCRYFKKGSGFFINQNCDGQSELCCIDAKGNVIDCWGNYNILGNIKKQSLDNIIYTNTERDNEKTVFRCKGCLSACYENEYNFGGVK